MDAFPWAEVRAADISPEAIRQLRSRFPGTPAVAFDPGEGVPLDGPFDLVVSVEVAEHVEDLSAYLRDVHRLLRPGGTFIWTTPCRNAGSIEHLWAIVTRAFERSETGELRWRWEDPTHLRRLTSREAEDAWQDAGFDRPRFLYRSHLFSFLSVRLLRGPLRPLAGPAAKLDYALFRHLPNGASMIGVARKPATGSDDRPVR